MNYYYANSDERALLTAGLRDLADFLDRNPQVPAPRWADLLVFPPRGTDAEMFREVDAHRRADRRDRQRRRRPGRPLRRRPLLRPRPVPHGRHPGSRPGRP